MYANNAPGDYTRREHKKSPLAGLGIARVTGSQQRLDVVAYTAMLGKKVPTSYV